MKTKPALLCRHKVSDFVLLARHTGITTFGYLQILWVFAVSPTYKQLENIHKYSDCDTF